MNPSQQADAAAQHQALERFAVTVAFFVRPERRDKFLKLVRMNAAASLKAETGCLCFDVLAPMEKGGPDVLLYEIYTDRAAFDTHLASAHFLAFDQATRDMVTGKTVAEFRIEAHWRAEHGDRKNGRLRHPRSRLRSLSIRGLPRTA